MDPLTGKPKLDVVAGGRLHRPNDSFMPEAQENDGGVSVSLMNNGMIRLTDRENRYVVEMPQFLAMDVGQRLISVATAALQMTITELTKNTTGVVQKPAIDIVPIRASLKDL